MGSSTDASPHRSKQTNASTLKETQQTAGAKNSTAASTCSAVRNHEKQKKSQEGNLKKDEHNKTREKTKKIDDEDCVDIPATAVSPQSEQIMKDTCNQKENDKNNPVQTTPQQKHATSTLNEITQETNHDFRPYNVQMRQVTDDNNITKNTRTIMKVEQKIEKNNVRDPKNDPDSMLKIETDHSISSEKQIHDLLLHRRLLLEGIRQCRMASAEQIKKMGTNTNDEVEEFRKITRIALQAIKRPQGQEKNMSSIQQRGAISLRKGSSVGKKMAAAVSTLNNSGGWISDSSSSTGPSQVQSTVYSNGSNSPPPNKDNLATSGKRDNSIPLSNKPGKLPLQTAINIKNNKLEPKIPSASSTTCLGITDKNSRKDSMVQRIPLPQISSLQSISPVTSKMKESSSLMQPNKVSNATQPTQNIKGASSIKNAPYNNNLGNPSVESIYSSNTHNAPLHLSQSGGKPFTNPLIPSHKMRFEEQKEENEELKIYHAEVNKLLKKRKSLQAEITARYQKRRIIDGKKGINQQLQKPRKKQFGKNPSPIIPSAIEWKKTNSFPKKLYRLEQKPLPCRRKTHWDYVLEEMRWLATDFIEERKWKAASGRSVASAVQSHFRAKINSSGRSPLKLASREKRSAGQDDYMQKNEEDHKILEKKQKKETNQNSFDSLPISCNGSSLKDIKSRMFNEPTIEDFQSAKDISKLMNLMVLTHLKSISNTQILGHSDSPNDELLSRAQQHFNHVKERLGISSIKCEKKLIDSNAKVKNDFGNLPSDDIESNSMERIEVNNDTNGSNHSCGVNLQCEELSHDEITARLGEIASQMNKLREECDIVYNGKSEDTDNKEVMGKITLKHCQNVSIKFFENLWKSDGNTVPLTSGAILSGPFGSGKTVSVGALLWKRRSLGSQILLCPSANFIRWRHELQRFEGLHVLTFGLQGWFHDKNSHTNQSQSYLHQKCNVILCEFSAFKRLCGKYCSKGKGILKMSESDSNESNATMFATTVLDARCLSAPSTRAYINSKRQDPNKGLNIPLCIPHELTDISWWRQFHSLHCFEKSKFLLIETSGYSTAKTSPHDYDNDTIDKNQKIQILGMKLAFINQQIFFSKLLTPESNACQWASKSCSDDSQKESNTSVDGLLMKSIISQTYFFEGALCSQNKNQREISSRHWNIKLCTLPNVQKRLYDESCFHLRGMLSSLGKAKHDENKSSENFLLCTDCRSLLRSTRALMRLRRLCLCSNMHEILSFPKEAQKVKNLNRATKTKLNDESASFLKLLCGSPSQPNVDFAAYVLDRSAKLRELYKFLTDECGYKNRHNHPSLNSQEVIHFDDEKILDKKKVLILATLPEAQVLVSKFLNSVGFAHELLMTHSYLPSKQNINQYSTVKISNGCSYKAIKQHMHDRANDVPESFFMSWIQSQQSISRYSTKCIDDSNKFISTDSCNILVSSPESFDSSSGGLIPSSADIVISLDEDWSGKGNLLLDSIASKIYVHKECSSKSSPTFIKFITEGTCEQTFFATYSTDDNQNQSIHNIPVKLLNEIKIYGCKNDTKQDDSVQRLQPSTSNKEFDKCSNLSHLGQNIFRFHDSSLSSILQTNELLPDELQSGKKSKFLSSHDLLCHENLYHDEIDDVKIEAKDMLSSYERIFGMILAQVEQLNSWIDIRIVVNDQIFFKGLIASIEKDSHSVPRFSLLSTAISAAFPSMISSRRDILSKPIQLFIERLKNAFCPSNSVQANVPLKEQKLCDLSTSKITPEGENISPEGMDMDFGTSWFFRGFGNKSESLAMSFLHYSDGIEKNKTSDFSMSSNKIIHDIDQEDTISDTKICESKTCKMVAKNRYAHIFSRLDCNGGSSLQDGNQGRESVVYFPPLFPGLLLTYHNNVIDSKNWVDAMNESVKKSLKRKMSKDEPLSNKRIRTESEEQKSTVSNDDNLLSLDFEDITGTNNLTDDDLADAFISSHAEVEAMCADLPNMETSDILFSSPLLDTSTPRREISEDPLLLDSDIPIDTKATTDNIKKVAKDNLDLKGDNDSGSLPNTTYGDFGILGFGILPTMNESYRIASGNAIRIHSHSISSFGSIPANNIMHIDSEVPNVLSTQTYRGASLDSVIIFVKYRPNISFLQENIPSIVPSIPYVASNITTSMNSAIPPSDSFRPIVSSISSNQAISAPESIQGDLNMVGSRKLIAKKQKKIQDVRPNIGSTATTVSSTNSEHACFPSTINSTFSSSFPTNLNDLSGCSAVKGQMTSDISGNIGFDAGFQKAFLDVRQSIQNEVNKGQHLYNISEDSSRLSSNPTEKDNMQDSLSQRDWILGIQKFSLSDQSEVVQSKPTYPPVNEKMRRVDFGPFQIGRFNLLDGTRNIQKDVSVKSGISLPMGVKMPHAKRETTVAPENLGTWSSDEDNQLRYYFDRYPFNWNAIARSMSYRIELCRKQELRSARQCRERWESLSKQTKVNYSLSNSRYTSTSGIIPSMQIALKKSLTFRNSTGIDRSFKNSMNSSLVKVSDRDHCQTIGHAQHTLLWNSSYLSKSRHVTYIANISKSEESEDLLGPKSVMQRLRASKKAILKRQHIPLTIPGCTAGNVPPSLPISSSHPSHSHSVQNAVSGSINSNGSMPSSTEMWPLQLLDSLGSQAKQEESTNSTTTKQVVPSSPQQNRSQQGNISNPTQHHSPNPYPQIHQQTHVNQPMQQKQTSMKSVSSSTRPQSQQDLLKQAARAAALAVPPNRSRTSKSMGDSTLRPNSSQHTMQLPPQIAVPNQHPAPISASSLPSHIHSQQQIPTGSLPIGPQTPVPTNVTPSPIVAPYSMNPNQRNHPSTQQSSVPPAYNSQKGPPYIKNTTKSRR